MSVVVRDSPTARRQPPTSVAVSADGQSRSQYTLNRVVPGGSVVAGTIGASVVVVDAVEGVEVAPLPVGDSVVDDPHAAATTASSTASATTIDAGRVRGGVEGSVRGRHGRRTYSGRRVAVPVDRAAVAAPRRIR